MTTSQMERLESRNLFSVLLFQPATGAYTPYTVLSQSYGDRINATTQSGFKYGSAGGFTPKIVADYGTSTGKVETWPAGYGNLPNVVFAAPTGQKFQMKLTADSGFNVSLASFDMASYGGPYTINSVSVTDGSGKTLFSKTNVVIATGTTHTHFALTNVKAQALFIKFDSSNAGGWNVGLSNVQFSQVAINPHTVSGTVFNDANTNGKLDAGESALAGFRVFIDANNDGRWDSSEASVLTDSSGHYSFTLTDTKTYIFGVQLNRGYYQTSPHALTYTVTNATLANANFGVKKIAPV